MRVCACVPVHACLCMRACACACACMRMCMDMCMRTCMCVCTCTCSCMRTCARVHGRWCSAQPPFARRVPGGGPGIGPRRQVGRSQGRASRPRGRRREVSAGTWCGTPWGTCRTRGASCRRSTWTGRTQRTTRRCRTPPPPPTAAATSSPFVRAAGSSCRPARASHQQRGRPQRSC